MVYAVLVLNNLKLSWKLTLQSHYDCFISNPLGWCTNTWEPDMKYFREFWLNWINWNCSANVKLYQCLQLHKSCFIALLFFFADKVYCSIISLAASISVSIYWTRSFSHGPRSLWLIAIFIACIWWFAVHCYIIAWLHDFFIPPLQVLFVLCDS